jgi:hypothetical protein
MSLPFTTHRRSPGSMTVSAGAPRVISCAMTFTGLSSSRSAAVSAALCESWNMTLFSRSRSSWVWPGPKYSSRGASA